MGGQLMVGSPAVGIGIVVLVMLVSVVVGAGGESATTSWCVARSEAKATALQTALDYACGAGADCLPIQSSGLCYLPNTFQAHASYAFNSLYHRKNMAPGSCDFAGTATVTLSDPSYGSCTYPASASSAGGTSQPPPYTPSILNLTNTPMAPDLSSGGFGGLTPGTGSTVPNTETSDVAPILLSVHLSAFFCFLLLF